MPDVGGSPASLRFEAVLGPAATVLHAQTQIKSPRPNFSLNVEKRPPSQLVVSGGLPIISYTSPAPSHLHADEALQHFAIHEQKSGPPRGGPKSWGIYQPFAQGGDAGLAQTEYPAARLIVARI